VFLWFRQTNFTKRTEVRLTKWKDWRSFIAISPKSNTLPREITLKALIKKSRSTGSRHWDLVLGFGCYLQIFEADLEDRYDYDESMYDTIYDIRGNTFRG
jgi:hypothetical protein